MYLLLSICERNSIPGLIYKWQVLFINDFLRQSHIERVSCAQTLRDGILRKCFPVVSVALSHQLLRTFKLSSVVCIPSLNQAFFSIVQFRTIKYFIWSAIPCSSPWLIGRWKCWNRGKTPRDSVKCHDLVWEAESSSSNVSTAWKAGGNSDFFSRVKMRMLKWVYFTEPWQGVLGRQCLQIIRTTWGKNLHVT